MITDLNIPANERGVLRLFSLSVPLAQDIADHLNGFASLSHALGIDHLSAPDVQIIKLSDIDDLGLPDFLQDGYDIAPTELTIHSTALTSLTGTIALVRSGAFQGRALRLTPTAQAVFVASFGEPGPDWTSSAHSNTSPLCQSPRKARSQARRIGLSLFAVMMTLIALFVLWLTT